LRSGQAPAQGKLFRSPQARPVAHPVRRATQGDNGKTCGFVIICHPNRLLKGGFLALFARQKAQKATQGRLLAAGSITAKTAFLRNANV